MLIYFDDLVFSCVIVSLCAVMCTEVKVLFLKPEEEKDKTHFTDKEVNVAGLRRKTYEF